ncbi:MAG TPA: methyl-accepting chemotaxis protein [Geobacteraceae bacterium]
MKRMLMDLNMSKKLMVAPAIVMMLLIVFGLMTYIGLQSQNTVINEYNARFKGYQKSAGILLDIEAVHSNLYRLLAWATAKYDQAKINELGKEQTDTIDKNIKLVNEKLAAKGLTEKERKLYEAVSGGLRAYRKAAGDVTDLAGSDINMATMFMGTADDKFDAIRKQMSDVAQLEETMGKAMEDSATKKLALIVTVLIATFLVALLMAVISSLAMAKVITTPLGLALATARRVSEGDLTISMEEGSKDEIGQIINAMGGMVESLRSMVAKIKDTSEQVASVAGQISANSAQLTKSVHSQASASDETSSTMVQMAASIQSVANNADALAANTEEVSSSIQELGVSSEQVAKSAEVMASSVSETSATIEQMTVSIEKVAQNSEDLASSVTETSSTIEQMTVSIEQVAGNSQELQKVVAETSATIEQMAASIKQTADNVTEADAVAKTAAKEGLAGQQAVQDALAAMQRVAEVSGKTASSIINLGKRSEEIGNIVKVINEIADQTNLLALNAAIEAARAGDAGRGFAVVADEVRKLAERSVNATKEIGQVIKQVQADTGDSVRYGELASREAQSSMELSAIAGNALANIIKTIEQTSELMGTINQMTVEQASASRQVTQAVEKMSASTAIVANAAREQALGGRQIRIAIEKMNEITREVTGATREQAQGSKQIRIAVENMNNVTQQVNVATREQALSARQIAASVNSMSGMTQAVANATAEQKRGGEMVVVAMENISTISRENFVSVEELFRSAEGLSRQALELAGLVAQFRVD